MWKFLHRFFLLTGILIMVAESPFAGKLELGAVFPKLVLPSTEADEALSVTDFRGEKLVLHIWASW